MSQAFLQPLALWVQSPSAPSPAPEARRSAFRSASSRTAETFQRPRAVSVGVVAAAFGLTAQVARCKRLQLTARRVKPKTGKQESKKERLRELENLVNLPDDKGSLVFGSPPPVLEDSGTPAVPRFSDVVSMELPRALPFLPDPTYRAFAANVPGDSGFDPLGLCTDVSKFIDFREAELKHARLAMLAALAWPLAEYYEPEIAEFYRLPDVFADTGGRVLPQLTGDEIGDTFVEVFASLVLAFGAAFELASPPRSATVPGDKQFDPAGLYSWSPPEFFGKQLPSNRPWMGEAELKHGRLAMAALLYDVYIEETTGNPVVEDTEFFFHRLDAKFLRWEYWTFQPNVLDSADALDIFPDTLDAPPF